MREIKFRGICVDTGEFIYGWFSKLRTGDQSIIFNPVGIGFYYVVKPETVGQLTGLKDKNGKEIYEGDVVKYIDLFEYACSDSDVAVKEYYYARISFLNGSFVLIDKEGEKVRQWTDGVNEWYSIENLFNGKHWDLGSMEIIGNIHENPELLG